MIAPADMEIPPMDKDDDVGWCDGCGVVEQGQDKSCGLF